MSLFQYYSVLLETGYKRIGSTRHVPFQYYIVFLKPV